MPSHSKKQHNFMDAIAHSPSFAKKAGVPQSVGKDYAAADKGKTFRKGGDMKESKSMVGKEVAFFKKKGAPKSMIKHEEAEMKCGGGSVKRMASGGKVRRMAMGGQGDSSFMTDEDYEKQKEQGAKNWKSLKNFFGFGEKDEPAPIDRSRDVSRTTKSNEGYTPRPPLGITKTNSQSPRTRRNNEDTSDSDAVERSDAAMLSAARDKTAKGPQFAGSLNGEFEDNAPAQRESKVSSGASGFGQTPYQDSGFSALNKPSRKPTTVSRTRETTSVTTAPSKTAIGVSDSSYSALERSRANKSPSSMLDRLRKESKDKILDSKPGSMTKQMRDAPTIDDLYRGQKSMSDEFGDVLKSFRSGIRGGLKSGEDKRKLREEEQHIAKGGKVKAYAQGGKVKKMAFGGRLKNSVMPANDYSDLPITTMPIEMPGESKYGEGMSGIPEDEDFYKRMGSSGPVMDEEPKGVAEGPPAPKKNGLKALFGTGNPTIKKIAANPKLQQAVSKVNKAVSKVTAPKANNGFVRSDEGTMGMQPQMPKGIPPGLDELGYGRASEESAKRNAMDRLRAQGPSDPREMQKQLSEKINARHMMEQQNAQRMMEKAPRSGGMRPVDPDMVRRFGMGPQGRASVMPPTPRQALPTRPVPTPKPRQAVPTRPVVPPPPQIPKPPPTQAYKPPPQIFKTQPTQDYEPPLPTGPVERPVQAPQEDYSDYGIGGGDGGGGGKRGGQVKKMASGGYTRAADGVAKKGKTQGKVVKMASGGFVKTADGIAQRGKTKAFQVKMNRGGRC